MLNRFFPSRPVPEIVQPTAPAGVRVYAVGDIHGCAGLLRRLHAQIARDAAARPAARNVIVYLGDYIDRGEESRGVVDLLLDTPLPGFEAVYLRGNHEASFLQFLEDTSVGPAWMAYGGVATLLSYGVRPPDPVASPEALDRAQRELVERLPDAHRRFMEATRLAHVEGDYYFAHAGVRPGVPLDRQEAVDVRWLRDDFLRSTADFGKMIVHGHTITEAPDVQRNRIGIDTGAFASGRLTCLVLDGAEAAFLQT
jgi:serine/threonine protein phosphatase 1